MKLRSLLFAALLLSVGVFVRADDAADGEVQDEPEVAATGEDLLKVTSASDVRTAFLFTQPEEGTDITAGKIVKYLIGFQNNGDNDYTVRFSDTSFRYPMDYSYHVQNFTAAKYDRVVPAHQESTFEYAFIPNEAFSGRPFGLVVNLHYEDKEGNIFTTTVYNQTINILEDESSVSGENGLLFITLLGIAGFIAFFAYQFLGKLGKKAGFSKKRSTVEVGTSNKKGEIDFEWIPRQVLNMNDKKSPKPGSPRVRKNN
uniref:Translocon-associated protein subunit alpha n=1 Tax=Steinernema glaseri TaxID=37863 RepID=A0A1I7YZK4_9BILA